MGLAHTTTNLSYARNELIKVGESFVFDKVADMIWYMMTNDDISTASTAAQTIAVTDEDGGGYGLKISNTFTKVGAIAHKALWSDLTYTPSETGTACPIAVAGKVNLNGNLTYANDYAGLGWGVQGQIHVVEGTTFAGGTADPGSIYAGVRGTVTSAGTSTYTSGQICCFYGNMAIGQENAGDGADIRIYGMWLLGTGSGNLPQITAGLKISTGGTGADWNDKITTGIDLNDSTTGIDIDDATTGIDIGSCITGINLSGTQTTGIVIGSSVTTGISVDSATDSESTVTGSIHTDGGLGVAKKLYTGNKIVAACTQDGSAAAYTHASFALDVDVGSGSGENIYGMHITAATVNGDSTNIGNLMGLRVDARTLDAADDVDGLLCAGFFCVDPSDSTSEGYAYPLFLKIDDTGSSRANAPEAFFAMADAGYDGALPVYYLFDVGGSAFACPTGQHKLFYETTLRIMINGVISYIPISTEQNTYTTAAAVALTNTLTVGVDATGHDVKFYGDRTGSDFWWDEDGESNVGSLNLGTTTASEGVDLLVHGDTASNYLQWDCSVDDLLLKGTGTQFVVEGTANATTTTTGSIRTVGGLAVVMDTFLGGFLNIQASAAETLLDFVLETEWTGGTLINADFGDTTVLDANVIGMELDFNGNLAGVTDIDVIGYKLLLPALTQTANTTVITGFDLGTSGALVNETGTIVWRGLNIQLPEITETSGSIVATGLYITGATINATGTLNGILMTGTLSTGIDLSGVTATNDIVLQNSATITNGGAGTLTITEPLIEFVGAVTGDTSVDVTATAPTGAENAIAGFATPGATWASGEVNAVYGKVTVTLDSDGSTYSAAGGHFELEMVGNATSGLGLLAGCMVKFTSNLEEPNAILYLESYPTGSCDLSETPFITFCDYKAGSGVKSNTLFRIGDPVMGQAISTGSGKLSYNQTLRCSLYDTAIYLVTSTDQGQYTTAYPIVSTYAGGTALSFTATTAATSLKAITVETDTTATSGTHDCIYVDTTSSGAGSCSARGIYSRVEITGNLETNSSWPSAIYARLELENMTVNHVGACVQAMDIRIEDTSNAATMSVFDEFSVASFQSMQLGADLSAKHSQIIRLANNGTITWNAFMACHGNEKVKYLFRFSGCGGATPMLGINTLKNLHGGIIYSIKLYDAEEARDIYLIASTEPVAG